MDTHIASHPDLGTSDPAMTARLPGEYDPPQFDQADGSAGQTPPPAREVPPLAARPAKRRRGLLAGVALLAVVGAVGGGVFMISSYNQFYPVPGLDASVRSTAASMGVTLPSVLAPSAALATVNVPPRSEATRDPVQMRPKGEQMAELLALHPQQASQQIPPREAARSAVSVDRPNVATVPQPAAATAAVTAAAVAPGIPMEPGSAAPVAAASSSVHKPAVGRDATAEVLAAIAPAPVATKPAAPARQAEPLPATASSSPATSSLDATPLDPLGADPAWRARELRPAPMTPVEQIQVLDLVTEMGIMVKDLVKQDAQLRGDLSKSAADTAVRMRDYERRLGLAEARQSLSGARQALQSFDDPALGTGLTVVAEKPVQTLQPAPAPVMRAVAVAPVSPTQAVGVKTYRVQAASPGLALLAQIERGGGEGAQLQVVVGDKIPDYGTVKSISQKGTAWVVLTERGPIQSQ